MAAEGRKDWRVIAWTSHCLREAGAPMSDVEKATAILAAIRAQKIYFPDPVHVESMRSAGLTLSDVFAGGDCFPVGTLVLTRGRGVQAVESLLVGEEIWGFGAWSRVEAVADKGVLPVTVVAVGEDGDRFVKLTSDHHVYVLDCREHPMLTEATEAAEPVAIEGSKRGCSCHRNKRVEKRPRVSMLRPGMRLQAKDSPSGERVVSVRPDLFKAPCWDVQTSDHRVFLVEPRVTVSQCDDLTIAFLAACGAAGIRVASVGHGFDALGQIQHVLGSVHSGGKWYYADASVKGTPFGSWARAPSYEYAISVPDGKVICDQRSACLASARPPSPTPLTMPGEFLGVSGVPELLEGYSPGEVLPPRFSVEDAWGAWGSYVDTFGMGDFLRGTSVDLDDVGSAYVTVRVRARRDLALLPVSVGGVPFVGVAVGDYDVGVELRSYAVSADRKLFVDEAAVFERLEASDFDPRRQGSVGLPYYAMVQASRRNGWGTTLVVETVSIPASDPFWDRYLAYLAGRWAGMQFEYDRAYLEAEGVCRARGPNAPWEAGVVWGVDFSSRFGVGDLGADAESKVLDLLDGLLPVSFDGVTNEVQLQNGAKAALAVLTKYGKVPDFGAAPPPAVAALDPVASSSDVVVGALSTPNAWAVLSNIFDIYGSALPTIGGAPLALTPDQLLDIFRYFYEIAANPTAMRVYSSGADEEMIQKGLVTRDDIALDIRRRMATFRAIVVLDQRGAFGTPGASTGTQGVVGTAITWEVAGIIAAAVVAVVLGGYFIYRYTEAENEQFRAICTDPKSRLSDQARASVCNPHVTSTGNAVSGAVSGLLATVTIIGVVAVAAAFLPSILSSARQPARAANPEGTHYDWDAIARRDPPPAWTLNDLRRYVGDGLVSVDAANVFFAKWVKGKAEYRYHDGVAEELLVNRRGDGTWRPVPWLEKRLPRVTSAGGWGGGYR